MDTHTARWRTAWLVVLGLLCCAALFGMTFNIWPGVPVRSNIMELLPALRDDPVQLQALQRSNDFMSRKLMILVGDPDPDRTAAATRAVTDSLRAQDFFSEPFTGVSSEEARATGAVYYRFRRQLLGEHYRELLRRDLFQRGDNAPLSKLLTQDLYSPLSGINADILAGDPLLHFYHFLRELPTVQGRMQSVDGALSVVGADRHYRVLMVDIRHDVFDMAFHPRYQLWRENLLAQIHAQYPQTEILLMGAVQHAVWGASSARHEVSTIGNGSLLGVIVLMLLVFRSVRVLAFSLLPLGAGVAAGLVSTLWYDGQIHLVTLVFGSTVIGVAMDYSLHFLTEHYKTSALDGSHPQRCLQQVFPGITFAMITSAIAYAAIGFAPFPVLRQIAIFSSSGLLMAWFTVVSLYAQAVPPARFADARWLTYSARIDDALRAGFRWRGSALVLCLLAVAMLPGILRLHANDDVHVLQTPDADISAMENRVQDLTGFRPAGRFFLVEGETAQQVLERCEALGHQLAQQHITHDLITHYLPSYQQQRENFTLLHKLFSANDFSAQWAQQLGLAAPVVQRAAEQFAETPAHWLSIEDLQQAPMGASLQRFQFAQTARGYITSVFVDADADHAAMQALANQQPGVHWMNPVQDISSLFQHFRVQACWMMLGAYTLIALLLLWRYGARAAWHVLLAPALAAWLTLGLLGYAGVAINLFHVLALLLVLGVGIDYSIFFAESSSHRDSTMLAVLLSTFTTLLSFGLLALSKTAAISGFGVVVSIGMVCALLFSPLAQHRSQHEAAP